MFQFFVFIMIICSAIWGSALVFALVGRLSRRVDTGNQDELMAILREEVESLSGRLGRVEEELDFYKKLQAPEGSSPPLLDKGQGDPEA